MNRHWCMYYRDTGEHQFEGERRMCKGCGTKEVPPKKKVTKK